MSYFVPADGLTHWSLTGSTMTDEDTFMGFSDGLSQSGVLHNHYHLISFGMRILMISYCLFTVVSAEVEMTAYGLLTYTLLGDVASALPVVKWLSQQRNALGGFSSTQVALFPPASSLFWLPQLNVSISV